MASEARSARAPGVAPGMTPSVTPDVTLVEDLDKEKREWLRANFRTTKKTSKVYVECACTEHAEPRIVQDNGMASIQFKVGEKEKTYKVRAMHVELVVADSPDEEPPLKRGKVEAGADAPTKQPDKEGGGGGDGGGGGGGGGNGGSGVDGGGGKGCGKAIGEGKKRKNMTKEEKKAKMEEDCQNAADLVRSLPRGDVVCWTDGACSGNPGPCGAGATICFPGEPFPLVTVKGESSPVDRAELLATCRVGDPTVGTWRESWRAMGQGTNNIGELTALILAFDMAASGPPPLSTPSSSSSLSSSSSSSAPPPTAPTPAASSLSSLVAAPIKTAPRGEVASAAASKANVAAKVEAREEAKVEARTELDEMDELLGQIPLDIPPAAKPASKPSAARPSLPIVGAPAASGPPGARPSLPIVTVPPAVRPPIAHQKPLAASPKLHILSDSKYAVNSVKGVWNGAANRELIARIRAMARAVPCELHWVKGHAGIPGNERADELAERGVVHSRKFAAKLRNGDVHTESAIVPPPPRRPVR